MDRLTNALRCGNGNILAGVGRSNSALVTTGLGEIFQYVIRPKKGYEEKYTAMGASHRARLIVRR